MAGDETSAADGRSRERGDFRASRADREQAIEVLKSAFVEDQLTKEELDARVGQALASRTCAELAALTSDLRAWPATPGPAVPVPAAAGPTAAAPPGAVAGPTGTPGRTLAKAARRSGECVLVALAVVGAVALTHSESWVPLAFFAVVAAVIAVSGFMGYGVVDAWQQHRSRGQLPPRPAHRGGAPEGQRRRPAGDDPAVPGARPSHTRPDQAGPDQTRADLRPHRSPRARPPRRPAAGRARCRPSAGWAHAGPLLGGLAR